MKELQITGTDAGQRLDKYLKRCLPEMGTSFLYKMLRKKNITLNGKKATGSELIASGDFVQCFFSDETFAKFSGTVQIDTDTDLSSGQVHETKSNVSESLNGTETDEYRYAFETLKSIEVLYEDEHLLLLNKPAGILTQKAEKNEPSLNEWMLGYLLHNNNITAATIRHFKPSVCNRLDRNTSGLVICGKTLIGSRVTSQLLKDRTLQKYYRTFVHGKLTGEATLTAYHRKDKKKNQADILFSVSDDVKKEYDTIVTSYRTLEVQKEYSYLEIELVTGKTHQIRAHLAALGHPIVGDIKYGQTKNSRNRNTKNQLRQSNQYKTTEFQPPCQLLHAYRIVFPNMEGDLAYLSGKEFVCTPPQLFMKFHKEYFG